MGRSAGRMRPQNVVFSIILQLFLLSECSTQYGESSGQHRSVVLHESANQVVMDNGIVKVTLSTPDGHVKAVSYNGVENLLEPHFPLNDRGYWDVVWNKPIERRGGTLDKLIGTSYKVMQTEQQIEISFIKTWNSKIGNDVVPLNVDKRFVMLRDSPGFYTYTILQRLNGGPDFDIQEGRVAFKLNKKLKQSLGMVPAQNAHVGGFTDIAPPVLKLVEFRFNYLAISDARQRVMPTMDDRMSGQELAYPEAVLLTRPTNHDLKGEVDDKYFYSSDNKDNRVHGWISTDSAVGFWMITPSNEFRTGGPTKQDLTSHTGPITLNMFCSNHYAGDDLNIKFRGAETWKKVLGPVFVYVNSNPKAKTNPSLLWDDAKQRLVIETKAWPYNFPLSMDYVHANGRGAVSGQLQVHDRIVNKAPVPAAFAYVGLALPGDAGSWQKETKGYQFWTEADAKGKFLITGVLPGTYNLYAWVPGTIGDYKYRSIITITPGSNIKLEGLVYEPPRNGATLWEIGIPDRTACEFFIPGPDPSYKVHPYKNPVDKFRQYGLWSRYTQLYPKDLVFTIGVSDYKKDWFFAHVNRNVGGTFTGPTWEIVFDLHNVNNAGRYTLQLALASADEAELQIRINKPRTAVADFSTGRIGEDNAVARHGIHGLYWLFSIDVPGSQLLQGRNSITLTQSRNDGPFTGMMYDYIRLEAAAAAAA